MVGALAGMGLNAMIGSIASQNQYDREIDKMQEQYRLNMQAANHSQTLAKQMWDYTNYENQVEHMKDAGLSVGLMYGTGGGGGQTTAGGRQEGVQQGVTQSVGMGLQMATLASELELKEAEAAKARAEAEKISGVDTDYTASLTSLNDTIKSMNEATTKLREAEAGKASSEIELVEKQIQTMTENLRSVVADADVKEATKEAAIYKAKNEAMKSHLDILQSKANIKLTETQQQLIKREVDYFTYSLMTERIKANAAAETASASTTGAEAKWLDSQSNLTKVQAFASELKKRCEFYDKQIEAIDNKIWQDWIFGSVNSLVQIGDLISDVTGKGLVKESVKKLFDDKGKQVGETREWERKRKQQ